MKHIQRGAALLTVLALLCTMTLPAAAASDTVTIATVQDLLTFPNSAPGTPGPRALRWNSPPIWI